MSYEKYKSAIDACNYCAAMCNQCAVACLEEPGVLELKDCIRLDMECAAICRSAAEVMALNGAYAEDISELCSDICNACAEECGKHAKMGMEHCRVCEEACRKCAEECMPLEQAV
ncbi:four-helix bundle copper-binding protein [Flavitalea flava]